MSAIRSRPVSAAASSLRLDTGELRGTGDILGAIVYHPGDLAWSWVVVARDHDDGTFRALDRDAARHVLDDARRRLVEKMAMALR